MRRLVFVCAMFMFVALARSGEAAAAVQLTFHVQFADDLPVLGSGSALVVVDTLAVPEPASLVIAGAWCAMVFAMRLRRR